MKNLMADLRDVPSWVWLGGAAALAFLFVLHRNSPSTSSGPAQNPIATANPSIQPGKIVNDSNDYSSQMADLNKRIDVLSQQWNSTGSYLPNGTLGSSYYPYTMSTPPTPPTPSSPETRAAPSVQYEGKTENGKYTVNPVSTNSKGPV